MKFKQKAKYSENTEKYPSWIAGSTKIILFLDMLKFSKNIFLKENFFFVKENEAIFGIL
jgi:hypothetical protein